MSITGIAGVSSGITSSQVNQDDRFARVKNDFESLGNALKSGNLDKAKEAFAQLQKDAPTGSKRPNPMKDDMDNLAKALESGDLTAAQDAYNNIQTKLSQGRRQGGSGGIGAVEGGTGSANKASGANTTSQATSLIYDKMDTNQDGTVSTAEELAYDLKHPGETNQKEQKGNNVDTLV